MTATQLIIVLAAMSALVSLVAIGIDWVGKPLRHKRFIPRMFRYEDEEFVTEYVHEPEYLPPTESEPVTHVQYLQPPHITPHPQQQPQQPQQPTQPQAQPSQPQQPQQPTQQPSQLLVSEQPIGLEPEVLVAPLASEVDPEDVAVGAFGSAVAGEHGANEHGADEHSASEGVESIAVGVIASTETVESAQVWDISMPLDVRVKDKLPTLSVKANRFWKARSQDPISQSQYDPDTLERMSQGKAPRRRNPRTGSFETPELFGLRAASRHEDVQIRWPDDSIDPWSS